MGWWKRLVRKVLPRKVREALRPLDPGPAIASVIKGDTGEKAAVQKLADTLAATYKNEGGSDYEDCVTIVVGALGVAATSMATSHPKLAATIAVTATPAGRIACRRVT